MGDKTTKTIRLYRSDVEELGKYGNAGESYAQAFERLLNRIDANSTQTAREEATEHDD